MTNQSFGVPTQTQLLAVIASCVLVQTALLIGCLRPELTHAKRHDQARTVHREVAWNRPAPGPQTVDRLTSGWFASPISLKGDSRQRKITSLEISVPQADGRGEFEFDQTKLRFDDFGSAEPVGETRTEKVDIRFQKFETDESKQDRRDIYKIEFPDALECELYLVLAKPLEKSRLVITNGHEVTNIIELKPVREIASRPETHELDKLDLTSELVPTERGLVNFRIEGEPGGVAKFHLNPNQVGFNKFGDRGFSTLLGWRPREVKVNHVRTESESGRELYEIVNDSPRQVQYFLVISKRDGQHRLVIRRGQTVEHVVPMRAK